MASQWIEGYQQASFRGVPFFIDSAENTGGRRIATHEFPEREDIAHEDLGKRAQGVVLSAYILGDNYFNAREALIKALNFPGPGRLVHPYRGIFEAVCLSWREIETTNEGRKATFSLTFEEDKVVKLTTSVKNTADEVREKKYSFLDTVNNAFIEAYTVAITGKTTSGERVSNISLATVQDAIKTVDKALDVIVNAKKVVGVVAEFQRELSNIRGKGIQLVLDATDLAKSFQSLLDFGTDPRDPDYPALPTTADATAKYRENQEIITAMEAPLVEDIPPEIYNDPTYPAKQIQTLVQYQTIATSSGLIPVYPLGTVQEAQEVKTSLFAFLDSMFLSPVIDDLVFAAVRDVKTTVSDDLDRRILDLSRIITTELVEEQPSLKFANTIYGNIDREGEIIARNNIEHPGFIPAALPIKIGV